MSVILTAREDGLAMFIDGNLQFHSADEALYHESLALPGLCLLSARGLKSFRVLICGGGDGLALRECLRFPGVGSVDLVDISSEVVDLGRNELAELNDHAFEDKRVRITIGDAWEFQSDCKYDLVVCDFTFPTSDEESALLSKDWFAHVRSLLTPRGIAAINAVSPEKTPEGFWCVVNSAKSARLSVLPFRACIPSFRDMGYGVWGFALLSKVPLKLSDLRLLTSPVPCRQADISRLWRGARFSRAERLRAKTVPIHTRANPKLIGLLLNPGPPRAERQEPELLLLDALIDAIPLAHPSHTREMIRTLAQQVVGSVSAIDLKRLVEAIWERAERLTASLRREIGVLREYLKTNWVGDAGWRQWSAKLFATLVIVLTVANSLSPDNAFAKGMAGLGHASMSRGSFSHSGEFGHMSAPEPAAIAGSGFRSAGFGMGGPVDIYGFRYPVRVYRYYDYGPGYYGGYGYGGYGNGNQAQSSANQPQDHQPVFVADDDMMVMDNGDVVLTLSDDAFLLARAGKVTLNSQGHGTLLPIRADSNMFLRISESLQGQRETARLGEESREAWLSWTGWTASMFDSVRQDKREVKNLAELQTKLSLAVTGLGGAPSEAIVPPPGMTEVFTGCYVLDGKVLFLGPENKTATLDGASFTDYAGKQFPTPKPLADALSTVILKLIRETRADATSYGHDVEQANKDITEAQSDLAQYNQILVQNGYDPTYEVDYGTDEIGVQDAIQRTNSDIASSEQDLRAAESDKAKAASDIQRLSEAYAKLQGTPAP